jgi:hypothetical protein
MGSLSHPMRNPNLSVHRWVLSGKLLEPPGAFWGFLGSPEEPCGVFWGLPRSSLEPCGSLPGISFLLFKRFRLHKSGRVRLIQAGKVQNALRAWWCTLRCDIIYVVGGRVGMYLSPMNVLAKHVDPYLLINNHPRPPSGGWIPTLNCAPAAHLLRAWRHARFAK